MRVLFIAERGVTKIPNEDRCWCFNPHVVARSHVELISRVSGGEGQTYQPTPSRRAVLIARSASALALIAGDLQTAVIYAYDNAPFPAFRPQHGPPVLGFNAARYGYKNQ